jgi:hypothetical protein
MSMNISKILERLAEQHKKKIMHKNQEITLEKAFALDGGLPILVRRANLLYDFLFGEKLQVSFRTEPGALAGESMVINPGQQSFVLVMMLYDVFEELVVNAGKGNITLA